jgi:hypothetical protein
MFLASCTPALWVEDSETEPSSAIDYWRQNAFGQYVVQISVVALAYFIAGKLGQATTSIRSSNLGPVWPAYGIALSSILLYGYRVWIGVAVGAFLVAFLSPVSHFAAAGQAAGATVAALTGAFLLHRVADSVTMSLVELEFCALSRSEERACQQKQPKNTGIPKSLPATQLLGRGVNFLTQRDISMKPRLDCARRRYRCAVTSL